MNYFSRLTDIVTCNLNEMLAREADPAAALAENHHRDGGRPGGCSPQRDDGGRQ